MLSQYRQKILGIGGDNVIKKEYQYWLSNIEELGAVRIQKLLKIYGSAREIYKVSKSELMKLEGFGQRCCEAFERSKQEEQIKKQYECLEKKEVRMISFEDKEYPKKLRNLYDPPYTLFVKGELPLEEKVSIAIVGARKCSAYGKEVALHFSRELTKAGVQVISGLAMGIDGYAHWGALKEGNSYAILGTGIDCCYPKSNLELYMAMQKKGGIISEYGLGICTKAWRFPRRNRIISGFSDGILIVEAREKSGSLITADLGLEQGKDVFAVPGRIGDSLSKGCNELIRTGAELVLSPEDLLNSFHLQSVKIEKEMKKNNNLLDSKEKIVYASLSLVPKHLDEILGKTQLIMSEVMAILVKLELKGYIKQTTKNYYIRQI